MWSQFAPSNVIFKIRVGIDHIRQMPYIIYFCLFWIRTLAFRWIWNFWNIRSTKAQIRSSSLWQKSVINTDKTIFFMFDYILKDENIWHVSERWLKSQRKRLTVSKEIFWQKTGFHIFSFPVGSSNDHQFHEISIQTQESFINVILTNTSCKQ